MAEEKLKNFGELLKETLGDRLSGGEITPVSESSTELSDVDRNAIFAKLASQKAPVEKKEVKESVSGNEDLARLPFGELLERTIKLRTESEEVESSKDDEIREAIISKSKMDMTADLLGRLMR